MRTGVMFSSKTDLWATPLDFFQQVDAEFSFDCDVCALPENAKCAKFFSPEENGLAQQWTGRCWMNPPYGRGIGNWVKKAYESVQDRADLVVCLLPARTDTAWWHEYVLKAAEVRFIRGRLKFGDSKNSAPFPSALVVFRKENREVCCGQAETPGDGAREAGQGRASLSGKRPPFSDGFTPPGRGVPDCPAADGEGTALDTAGQDLRPGGCVGDRPL